MFDTTSKNSSIDSSSFHNMNTLMLEKWAYIMIIVVCFAILFFLVVYVFFCLINKHRKLKYNNNNNNNNKYENEKKNKGEINCSIVKIMNNSNNKNEETFCHDQQQQYQNNVENEDNINIYHEKMNKKTAVKFPSLTEHNNNNNKTPLHSNNNETFFFGHIFDMLKHVFFTTTTTKSGNIISSATEHITSSSSTSSSTYSNNENYLLDNSKTQLKSSLVRNSIDKSTRSSSLASGWRKSSLASNSVKFSVNSARINKKSAAAHAKNSMSSSRKSSALLSMNNPIHNTTTTSSSGSEEVDDEGIGTLKSKSKSINSSRIYSRETLASLAKKNYVASSTDYSRKNSAASSSATAADYHESSVVDFYRQKRMSDASSTTTSTTQMNQNVTYPKKMSLKLVTLEQQHPISITGQSGVAASRRYSSAALSPATRKFSLAANIFSNLTNMDYNKQNDEKDLEDKFWVPPDIANKLHKQRSSLPINSIGIVEEVNEKSNQSHNLSGKSRIFFYVKPNFTKFWTIEKKYNVILGFYLNPEPGRSIKTGKNALLP
jgi:hypothetical protein